MSTGIRSLFARIDALTLLLYFILVLVGLMAVFSVEYRSTDVGLFLPGKNYTNQAIFLGISLFAGLIILFTDSKAFASMAFLSYLFGIVLLVVTIFLGKNVKGSHSWLSLGPVAFQPGEVCKIFTSLALAKFLSLNETDFSKLKDRLIGAAFALLPAIIIVLQSETGLALVYVAFFLAMYREGLPNGILICGFSFIALAIASLLLSQLILFIILTALAALFTALLWKRFLHSGPLRLLIIGSYAVAILFSQLVVPFAFRHVLHRYQTERIYAMLGQDVPEAYLPESELAEDEPTRKKDNNYNVTQSKIAIGSGGLWGKGILNGTSTKNGFVPEQHTDFIFSSIAEQFGFVGSALLILIYVLLMLRISFLAERQRSTFSRVYAYCVASILFVHFAINISMTIGLAPVIGITLPFLSYGGSSLLSFSILIFILLRLDADRAVLIR
ncbi:MAG: rod shape-determining protein RodA [Bacteroidetes bacterium]|nr:rod shape-determining protein RodA [Bacteroidota bacterium]MBS1628951.1 rod shape-determining protein RodA [Bacteroidota bacterium]